MKFFKIVFVMIGFAATMASPAKAQFSLSIGNPYAGGIGLGSAGYGYSSGYSNYSGIGSGLGYGNNYQSYSNSGYLAGPGAIGGTYGYNSGYSGLGGYNTGYRSRPYYGNYGYGNSSNGSRDGFAPFRPLNGFRRYR